MARDTPEVMLGMIWFLASAWENPTMGFRSADAVRNARQNYKLGLEWSQKDKEQ